jgi:hypothetical protein
LGDLDQIGVEDSRGVLCDVHLMSVRRWRRCGCTPLFGRLQADYKLTQRLDGSTIRA